MIITVFDYGAGNLHSLAKALAVTGHAVRIEPDPLAALDTDVLVLPGVGAFASAASRLAPGRLAMRRAIDGGLPCLGICLGMQLLFDSSAEGPGEGLGVIAGRVTRLDAPCVPHIGWNTIELPERAVDPLLGSAPLEYVYYAHSYACRPAEAAVTLAWSRHHDDRFAAVVRHGSAFGVQFHPEKSSRPGVRFLQAFLAAARNARDLGTPFATCADIDFSGADNTADYRLSGPGAMPCS